MSPNGCCRATGACWWATAACRGWRQRCCGCAAVEIEPRWAGWAAVVFWIALAGLTPTGLMLAAIVALVCVAMAGPGVPRARCCRRYRRRVGARGDAVAGRVGARRCARVVARRRVWRRSPRAPSRAWAPSAAWPGWAASGMPRPYRPRGQHFSQLAATLVLLARGRDRVCPTAIRVARRACRCWCWRRSACVLPAAMATGPGLAALEAVVRRRAGPRRAARRAEVGGAGDAGLCGRRRRRRS